MIILILSFAPFRYEGTSFLFTTALSATIGIGIVLLGQMTGLHRRIFELSNGFILIIPLCFLVKLADKNRIFLFSILPSVSSFSSASFSIR